MALPSLSFVFGLLVLLYLSSFVAFAVLRVVTGVSIQRLGFTTLRRIAYTPRDGLRLEIRGLGLQIHRPTFAQPTWISLVITELKITLDLEKFKASRGKRVQESNGSATSSIGAPELHSAPPEIRVNSRTVGDGHQATWARLIEVKEKIKRLHRVVPWIRLFDVVARNSSLVVCKVGTVQVGSFLVSVDTRPSTVDRSRLFRHSKRKDERPRPVEWTFSTRSILFTPDAKEPIEILDHAVLNVYGYLVVHLEGLREASISLKLGRLHIPYDDFQIGSALVRDDHHATEMVKQALEVTEISHDVKVNEDYEDDLLRSLRDAKGFVTSMLGGIHEVSFAASFVGLSMRSDVVHPAGGPVYYNMGMKELGMDLYRLDPNTPAHSMYFAKNDVAHQALISAISIGLGIDDGHASPERLVYIPMTTATIKTTLPSKILQFTSQEERADRNTNVFFANLVITSPSIDLDPRRLALVLAIIENRSKSTSAMNRQGRHIVSRLLPRINVRLFIHEPVLRIALPPVEAKGPDDFDFDLLISAFSAISLDIESQHSEDGDLHYSLSSTLRITSHKLYYQTTSRLKYNLLISDTVEMKAVMTAAPQILVAASARLQTFSVFMVRHQISSAIGTLINQLRTNVKPEKLHRPRTSRDQNLIRALPPWLRTLNVQAFDFNIELAGVDSRLSSQTRGLTVHLDSWTMEYKAQKDDSPKGTLRRRKTASVSKGDDEVPIAMTSPRKQKICPAQTDGRRVAIHVRGFEAFVIESSNNVEQEPFLSVPRSEIAFTTAYDGQIPVLHINSSVKALFVQYSLFSYYAIGVALIMLRKTFTRSQQTSQLQEAEARIEPALVLDESKIMSGPTQTPEFITVDIKSSFIQIKAVTPSEPYMMLHIHNLEAGRHRWTTPFVKTHNVRLFTQAPQLRHVWARLICSKGLRVDLREGRRRQGSETIAQRSIDVVADAIKIGITHQLVVHTIFDNLVNLLKATKQLNHRFRTDSEDYILQKSPEGPKHVPRISIRTHVLGFEIEDSVFEWKLGIIFRAGMIEQKQRIAREEAFRIKVARLEASEGRNTSETGTKSSQQKDRGQDHAPEIDVGPSRAHGPASHNRHSSPSGHRTMRYNREHKCNLSGQCRTSISAAWERLQRLNAQSWRRRVDYAMSFQIGAIDDIRALLWGVDAVDQESWSHETILSMPRRPPLLGILMSDVQILLDKPSFAVADCPDFLYRVGKGLPRSTQFSLLVPMNAQLNMGECHVLLRDYPLPLIHIPAIKPGQSSRLPSWSLRTDFVIAEEFRGYESTRDVEVMVIPPDKFDPNTQTGAFAIDVRRTVSPVKTYSDINIEINTAGETRFTWGTSYQPAIQDVMQVIEGFTKPQLDQSDRVGFWDKIRLSFHSKLKIDWKGDGDVYLTIKGSRDPYAVTGHAAGFVMVWRNDVCWSIWQEEDPRRFMTVDSGDYVLAIPDFSHHARHAIDAIAAQAEGSPSVSSGKEEAHFKKVIMKLSGKIKWEAGLVFERDVEGGGRSFDFSPHYNVTLINPAHRNSSENAKPHDSFQGFRSNHIHMSIAVIAPTDREWVATNLTPAGNYNSVHLTPRFFTHFFAWWAMFSGTMSLPVRQGRLWPGPEKSGKKFGRHLATIKYKLLLSPLFISHVYKHKEAEEFSDDAVFATGLKLHLDSFTLDIHQRREEFKSVVKGLNKTVKTTHIKINEALLDLVAADMRAVSAVMTGTSASAVRRATADRLAGYQQSALTVDLSRFTIPDNDFSWIDIDDFVEVDWTLPSDADPETKILPLAYAPRFTYRRQTDHGTNVSGDVDRSSPWGVEDTHYCSMSDHTDLRVVQIGLVQHRLQQINELLLHHERNLNEQELLAIREGNTDPDHLNQKKLEDLRDHGAVLHEKKTFLNQMLKLLSERLHRYHDFYDLPYLFEVNTYMRHHMGDSDDSPIEDGALGPSDSEFEVNADVHRVKDFNNRFVVHYAQIKWNNSLRNIMLRYIHQVSQRRGFVYYTSRRAVKFILDIIEEQHKSKLTSNISQESKVAEPSPPLVVDDDDEMNVEDRIQQILRDGRSFIHADESEAAGANRKEDPTGDRNNNISQEFKEQKTYYVRLIGPQIQLQSEKNTKAAVIVTARGMRLRVIQVMDKDRLSDDVSGLVQRRFTVDMDNMQFFVTSKQIFSSQLMAMYSGNAYGIPKASFWPPWLPIEVMFDFRTSTYGFSRVVQRTSATLKYDKYNRLRLKLDDHVTEGDRHDYRQNPEASESQMDHCSVDFPHVRAVCDSTQYYAMYVIVLDLLMWNEPLEKSRNERLEKIMLAADFSDLRGAPEMVVMLQERIRMLEEIKTHFHINEKYLDRQGWEDRIAVEQDLTNCEDELFFIMKAITSAQRKFDDRTEHTQVNATLRWHLSASEIVWHMTEEENHPLVEVQLGNASYQRTDNSDGSNRNEIKIHRIHALNLLPTAMYPEMITAYQDLHKPKLKGSPDPMLCVDWLMLEAIAGIPVVDHFDVILDPIQIALEYEIGKRLIEYIFPGKSKGDEGFSALGIRQGLPQHDEEDESDDEMNRQASIITSMNQQSGSATGAGSLESRLQPTLRLPESRGSSSAGSSDRNKPRQGLGISIGFHKNHSKTSPRTNGVVKINGQTPKMGSKFSNETLNSIYRGRESTKSGANSFNDGEKRKRFLLSRTHRSDSADSKKSKNKKSDDLTQMLNRASSYMTLAYIRIPSVVLSLSYHGKGNRNVEDVHNLVFRMPTLEYRNKTWSNLDLVNALKKDVIRAFLSHTGAIIGNKLTHHKPNKQQASRLRNLASSSVVLNSANDVSSLPSENSSYREHQVFKEDAPRPSDVSDVSAEHEEHTKSAPYASSIATTADSPITNHEPHQFGAASTPQVQQIQTEHHRDPRRGSIARHLSELTQKAVRRTDSSHGDDDIDKEPTTAIRGTFKKILHVLPHRN